VEVILLPRIRLQLSASTLFAVGRRRRDEDRSDGLPKTGRDGGERGEASWKATRRAAAVRVFLIQVLIDLLF
jgi:hypothetical protein